MKEETARELYSVLENACSLLKKATKIDGSPDDIVRKGIGLMPGASKSAINAVAKDGAMGFFGSIPEPSEEEKAQLITFFGDFPFLLRKALLQAGKELPYRHGKRTPPKLDSPQKRKKACEDVARLLSVGVEKPTALKRVGQKYAASSRTIRRIWDIYCKTQPARLAADGE